MDKNAKLPLSGLAIDTSWPTLKDNEVLAGDLDKERRDFWGLAIDAETPTQRFTRILPVCCLTDVVEDSSVFE